LSLHLRQASHADPRRLCEFLQSQSHDPSSSSGRSEPHGARRTKLSIRTPLSTTCTVPVPTMRFPAMNNVPIFSRAATMAARYRRSSTTKGNTHPPRMSFQISSADLRSIVNMFRLSMWYKFSQLTTPEPTLFQSSTDAITSERKSEQDDKAACSVVLSRQTQRYAKQNLSSRCCR
jgi:hypothetical protein